MINLWDKFLVWIGVRHESFWFLSHDGETQLSLDGIACRTCQNHFWVVDAAIEMPSFCCYCGTKFKKIEIIDNNTFDDVADSSN